MHPEGSLEPCQTLYHVGHTDIMQTALRPHYLLIFLLSLTNHKQIQTAIWWWDVQSCLTSCPVTYWKTPDLTAHHGLHLPGVCIRSERWWQSDLERMSRCQKGNPCPPGQWSALLDCKCKIFDDRREGQNLKSYFCQNLKAYFCQHLKAYFCQHLNHIYAKIWNQISVKIGNHNSDKIGNHITVKIWNHLSVKILNHTVGQV